MRFEFATATRIIFGSGTLKEIAPLAAGMGRRVMVVLGGSQSRAAGLLDRLIGHGLEVATFTVKGEPTTAVALAGAEKARQAGCELVIGLGGGSVLDTGKAVAALLTNKGDLLDYLEVIGQGRKLEYPSAPYIAVPTTAGTGAEVTSNSVLGSPGHGVKVSMRSPFMLPKLAVVDPELTLSLPPDLTAGAGLDALTQLIEAFVTPKANPLTDGLCREGLVRAARSLPLVLQDGRNQGAREDMSLAALFSGLALANAKLGAVHGLAGPLGGMIPAPHGMICAAFLPHVMEANIRALKTRAANHPALTRYDEVARIITGNEKARAEDGLAWVLDLVRTCKIPTLAALGLNSEDIPTLVNNGMKSSSMKGNPVELTEAELTDIINKTV